MKTNLSSNRNELLALTAEIVSAYAENNMLDLTAVPEMIGSIFATLSKLSAEQDTPSEILKPAVPIRQSVTDDYLICLEDGKKFKTLKRHLFTAYGMTPAEYRTKWRLKPDYPMIAPRYAAKRQEIAKKIGLGYKPQIIQPELEPELVPAPAPIRSPRKKSKAVA